MLSATYMKGFSFAYTLTDRSTGKEHCTAGDRGILHAPSKNRRRFKAEYLTEIPFLPGDTQLGQERKRIAGSEAAQCSLAKLGNLTGKIRGRKIPVGDIAHASSGHGQLAPRSVLRLDQSHGKTAPGSLPRGKQTAGSGTENNAIKIFHATPLFSFS